MHKTAKYFITFTLLWQPSVPD